VYVNLYILGSTQEDKKNYGPYLICSSVGWGIALQAMGLVGFFIDLILPAELGPWVQLSLLQKWEPGLSHWDKGDW